MIFTRLLPSADLHDFIECFWVAENDDVAPAIERIIPDGFTEVIFHYRDPYRINLHGDWEIQSNQLFCGQISKHFLLENTGASGMLGIKFKPTALARILGISMHPYTDRVVPLQEVAGEIFSPVYESFLPLRDHRSMIEAVNRQLAEIVRRISPAPTPADHAVALVIEKHGMLSVSDLCDQLKMGERNLERAFRQYVGLSPKFYARLIRFARIFQLVREHREHGAPWSDLVHALGYYDQPHFIRNFRAFAGEEPSGYFFDHPTMANFFLVK